MKSSANMAVTLGTGDRAGSVSWLCSAILVALVIVSFGDITPALLPASFPEWSQQAITLVLWLTLAVMTTAAAPSVSCSVDPADVLLMGAFYGLPIVSFIWSADPTASAPKCLALAVTTLSVWQCAMRIPFQEYARCASIGLSILLLFSVFLAILVPNIGLMHDWEHAGAWSGVFAQKQSLGIAAALLALFSINLFCHTRRLLFLAEFLLSIIVTLGSTSRGSLVIITLATAVSLLLWLGRSTWPHRLASISPVIIVGAATFLIIYLGASGATELQLLGYETDISSRTVIWQHGLSYWTDAPILGSGLDAFWQNEIYYLPFLAAQDWVLTDFHSGYLEILIETGIAGYVLMVLVTLRLSAGLNNVPFGSFAFPTTAVFMLVFYILNISETFFLRSTNFVQLTFLFLMMNVIIRSETSNSSVSESSDLQKLSGVRL